MVTSVLILSAVRLSVSRRESTVTRSQSRVPREEAAYLLGVHEDRLAVFLPGEEEPELLFAVYVHQLPAYDQGQLRQGIAVEDYPALVALIEDYIS